MEELSLIDFIEGMQPEKAKIVKPEIPELTVSEISFEIKRFVETTFGKVRVRGEIFGAKRADSGHYYLSLKDENAVLSAVCWKGVAAQLAVKPEDGLEVVATGKITTFAGKSSYQLVIEQMEVAGAGALLKLLEERKKQYADEGLFDAAHKQKIPYLPKVVGVVTSASGAVIRDIIHRIRDRFPRHVLLWPTPVQGEGAAEKIAAAINGFNALPENGPVPRPDVLIVARGGGSLEDLWPFNEDVVIRAVYASKIPLISAVGHETDTMLIDYVSDLRAPTPTGAAEFAVPVRSELLMQTENLGNRLRNAMFRYFEERWSALDGLGRGIPNLRQILLEQQQKLDDRVERLKVSFAQYLDGKKNQIMQLALRPYYIRNIVEKKEESLGNLSIRLENVSIEAVLKRGFVWVRDSESNTVYSAEQARRSAALEINFADGPVKVTAEPSESLGGASASKPGPKKVRKVMKNENLQADLFGL
jgi:exodeoxyribonuclease VII, large subunit